MFGLLGSICRSIINTLINPVPLFEWLIISDSICSSINFIKNYIEYKTVEKSIRNSKLYILKDEIVKQYNNLYTIDVFDRYILYLFLYSNYIWIIFINESDEIKYALYIFFTLFTIPVVQNNLLKITYVELLFDDINNDKKCFMKYTISKLTIKCIKELDTSIVGIKNYHIFILYNYISFNYLFEFIKCYLLLYSLNLLRNSASTYYYYKAIKIAYYYNTGYLFNIITKEDAINRINTIIRDKKWKELSDIENVNSFYTLLHYKFNSPDNKSDIYIYILGFFSLWSLICVLKVINYFISILFILSYISIYSYNDQKFLKRNYQKIFIGILMYTMIFLGINDLVITLVCSNYKIFYYMLNEVYFYMQYKTDIKKVLKHYKLKDN